MGARAPSPVVVRQKPSRGSVDSSHVQGLGL